ncbi:ankyrin repeat-containing domain protein [Cercophora newfieldiana]|uniref:Ankyrin repeat-containing domain protein n=1 Tax=Cercophora newfieldiana TaxID=92897 RepID=A0AA40CJQ0_9PEZI|nr:ankyrin repeat-containing domain protein [Cercophora newfieldiana]
MSQCWPPSWNCSCCFPSFWCKDQTKQASTLGSTKAMKLFIQNAKDAQVMRQTILENGRETTKVLSIESRRKNEPRGIMLESGTTSDKILAVNIPDSPRQPSTEKMLVAELPSTSPASCDDGIDTALETNWTPLSLLGPSAQGLISEPRLSGGATASINSAETFDTSSKKKSPRALKKMFNKFHFELPAKPATDPRFLISQLSQACWEGNYDWAQSLLGEGVDVNGLDARHRPPLFYAISCGHLDIMKLLVDNGAQVGGYNGESSAMVVLAVFKDNIPVLQFLLDQSPPVSSECWHPKVSNCRTTPLSLAVEVGRLEAVKLLLDHGADVHETSRGRRLSPLCLAVDKGNADVVQLLLDHDASIDAADSVATWASHVTPLHIASYRGYDEILGALLSNGANITATCRRGGVTGVTALHLAANDKCVDKLVEWGAKVHAIDSKHQHPLSVAVQLRALSSVQALLGKGSPVNAQDYMRETALEIACKLFVQDAKAGVAANLDTYRDIVEELITGGANSGSKLKGARVVRAEYDRLRRSKKLHWGTEKKGLVELLNLVIEMVQNGAAEPPRKAANAVKSFFEGIVTESLLAKAVTGERS